MSTTQLRTRKQVGVPLPDGLDKKLNRLAKREHRNRADMVRELIRRAK
jgi:metal-responsive CopG/Arc/MetJ family transcriptional regulator